MMGWPSAYSMAAAKLPADADDGAFVSSAEQKKQEVPNPQYKKYDFGVCAGINYYLSDNIIKLIICNTTAKFKESSYT